MKKRVLFGALFLCLAALGSSAAWAAPCCTSCPSWPDLDPDTDRCARFCSFSCFAAPDGPSPILDLSDLTASPDWMPLALAPASTVPAVCLDLASGVATSSAS